MEENQKAIIGDISPTMIKICTFYSKEKRKNLRKLLNMCTRAKSGLMLLDKAFVFMYDSR